MSKNSWSEHRLLVLQNFERQEKDIENLKKQCADLKQALRDQNWKMIIMAIVGGIGGGGGVDLIKFLMSSFS